MQWTALDLWKLALGMWNVTSLTWKERVIVWDENLWSRYRQHTQISGGLYPTWEFPQEIDISRVWEHSPEIFPSGHEGYCYEILNIRKENSDWFLRMHQIALFSHLGEGGAGTWNGTCYWHVLCVCYYLTCVFCFSKIIQKALDNVSML